MGQRPVWETVSGCPPFDSVRLTKQTRTPCVSSMTRTAWPEQRQSTLLCIMRCNLLPEFFAVVRRLPNGPRFNGSLRRSETPLLSLPCGKIVRQDALNLVNFMYQ
jgi:hypothetical protein